MIRNNKSSISLLILFLVALFTFSVVGEAGEPKGSGDIRISSPEVSVSSPIFVVYVEDMNNTDGVGTYTIKTGVSHPNASQNVFYGGSIGDAWSTYNTIRVNGSKKEYVETNGTLGIPSPSAGFTLERLNNYVTQYPNVVGNSIVTRWTTPENLNITQIIAIIGSSLSDSSVRVTTQIRNDNASEQQIGVRYEWDLEINESDDSLFRTKNPDGTFNNVFGAFTPPAFGYYEVINNRSDLSKPFDFSVFGSVSQPTFLSPPPTMPDSLMYVSWSGSYHSAFDYIPSGAGIDSAMLYYWNPITIQPGQSVSLTAYVTTEEQAISGGAKVPGVPSLTPIGIVVLTGLLAIVAVATLNRRL